MSPSYYLDYKIVSNLQNYLDFNSLSLPFFFFSPKPKPMQNPINSSALRHYLLGSSVVFYGGNFNVLFH